MKIVILCSYPPRFVTNDKFMGSKKTHVSSWNIHLIEALSKINDLDIFVLCNGAFFKTRRYKKNNINYIYVSRIPVFDNYFPNLRRKRFQKYIDEICPDVVHGIGTEHLYPWFAIKSKYKNIITVHGILSNIIKKPSYKDKVRIYYENYSFRNVTNLISVSDIAELTVKDYNPDVCVYKIYNPISNNFFDIKYKATPKNFDIMLVGMIYPLKNTHLIVSIVEQIKKVKKDIKVGIIGNPIPSYQDYYDKIIIDISKKSLKDNIHFFGQIENNNVPKYLSKSKILLHLSKQETGPMVIVESLALGLFIISNNVGNVSQIISENNGIILKTLDTNYISSEIVKSLKIISKKKPLGNDIKNEYSPDNIAIKTYNAYKDL